LSVGHGYRYLALQTQLTRCRVDGISQVVEFDVDGRSFRFVRQRLHVNSGRDPGDRPVGGHAEHPRPGRIDQRHLVLVLPFGAARGWVIVVVVVVAAVVAVVVRRSRKRDGALHATHRRRLLVSTGHDRDDSNNSNK